MLRLRGRPERSASIAVSPRFIVQSAHPDGKNPICTIGRERALTRRLGHQDPEALTVFETERLCGFALSRMLMRRCPPGILLEGRLAFSFER